MKTESSYSNPALVVARLGGSINVQDSLWNADEQVAALDLGREPVSKDDRPAEKGEEVEVERAASLRIGIGLEHASTVFKT